MRNVRELCKQGNIEQVEIYYLSRSYLTRHGAGPLPNEDKSLRYFDNTNNENQWQGALRFAPICYKSLVDQCDKDAKGQPYKLVVTHCDQLEVPDLPWLSRRIKLKSYGVSRNSVQEMK
jgi:hypothetical protein